MLALALSLLAAPNTPPPAPPQRYRLVVKTYAEQDFTSRGQGKTSGSLTATVLIAVTMTDTVGGQIVRVTVDSMTLDPTGTIAQQLQGQPNAAQQARGAFVRVYVARGAIKGPMHLSDSTNRALSVVTQAVGVLFPGIKRGVKVGDSWADTSRINNGSGPRRQTGEVVAAWKVTAAEGDALVLDGTSQTHTRTEDGSGQVLLITGGSKEHVVVPSQGPVRRAAIETSNDITMTTPQSATPIPGKTTGSLVLTPIE